MNAKRALLWAALAVLGLLLVIAGFQGSLGRMLAVFFAPGDLVVKANATT